MDLRGYSYEPEYTTEELDELSRAAVASCAASQSSVVTDWCQCGRCHPMPTAEESVCCRSSDLTVGSLKDLQCITDDRRMQSVVLNDDVLSVMYVQMMLDTGKQGRAPDVLDDKYVVDCSLKCCSRIVVNFYFLLCR